MPLPLIIGIGATLAGIAGIGSGIHGGVKMKEANNTIKEAKDRNERNVKKLETLNTKTMEIMDMLGKHEMEIISSFQRFSDVFEKIKNAPSFHEINKDNVSLPIFTPQEIKKAAVGATVLLGGLGGAALGTASGFAAAGGTTAAIMALGTASTGTAIASLSGAAATNATLALLGGGTLAAGGGGVALGTAILGGATLGVGLLIGGIVFNITGSKISDKADKAWEQMKENERKIDSICKYLERLKSISLEFERALLRINKMYMNYLLQLEQLVEEHQKKKFFLLRLFSKKVDYNKFSNEEKKITENVPLFVGLLYEMCKVQLVEKSVSEDELNRINEREVHLQIEKSEKVLERIAC